MGKKILNSLILNKFLSGASITKINPIKLLIKKRGYRDTLVQKSLILDCWVKISIMIIYYFLSIPEIELKS